MNLSDRMLELLADSGETVKTVAKRTRLTVDEVIAVFMNPMEADILRLDRISRAMGYDISIQVVSKEGSE